jgi:hypothetical protein
MRPQPLLARYELVDGELLPPGVVRETIALALRRIAGDDQLSQ